MTALRIWRVAETVRRHVCLRPRQHKVELQQLVARLRSVEINGISIDLSWEMEDTVCDHDGKGVMGSTDVDPSSRSVIVQLNAGMLGRLPTLLRSTALHELGHVIFDAPGWVNGGRHSASTDEALQSDQVSCLSEWRANEFMGGFLAPQPLLHAELIKHAYELKLPLVESRLPSSLPILAIEGFSPWLDTLHTSLGKVFGLSPSFIAVRLERYRLIASRMERSDGLACSPLLPAR